MFVGLTALSEDINTNLFTLYKLAKFASFRVPNTLFIIPTVILFSSIGTCL